MPSVNPATPRTNAIDTVRVGHWTHPSGTTGCTVVLFPPDTIASGEVRGGAPATREFALLDPRRLVQHVDAVVLTGGSAFGLAAADGVAAELEAQERGFATRAGVVPIVVAMSLYDLQVGGPRPDPEAGRSAVRAARSPVRAGRVGAGAGATVGKWRDREKAQPAGIGHFQVKSGELTVDALIAVNAAGEIDDGSIAAHVVAGDYLPSPVTESGFENTTIGVVWTNGILDKLGCRQVAESAHDGLGRALIPAHSASDGDALVVAATGMVATEASTVRLLATVAVEHAIRSVAIGQ